MISFKNLSKQSQHGLFLVIVGVTFLLFISGIIAKILFYPLLIAGFGFIGYGLYECEVFDNIKVLNKYLPKKKLVSHSHKSHNHKSHEDKAHDDKKHESKAHDDKKHETKSHESKK